MTHEFTLTRTQTDCAGQTEDSPLECSCSLSCLAFGPDFATSEQLQLQLMTNIRSPVFLFPEQLCIAHLSCNSSSGCQYALTLYLV